MKREDHPELSAVVGEDANHRKIGGFVIHACKSWRAMKKTDRAFIGTLTLLP
jgi:hypothetical protein